MSSSCGLGHSVRLFTRLRGCRNCLLSTSAHQTEYKSLNRGHFYHRVVSLYKVCFSSQVGRVARATTRGRERVTGARVSVFSRGSVGNLGAKWDAEQGDGVCHHVRLQLQAIRGRSTILEWGGGGGGSAEKRPE